ncbi:hypothetical protein BX285_6679 [Streptomyces sp. 1114.5]|nr:hypothetical protein BX285_6679 [Streptomyces sp. 1114.5]
MAGGTSRLRASPTIGSTPSVLPYWAKCSSALPGMIGIPRSTEARGRFRARRSSAASVLRAASARSLTVRPRSASSRWRRVGAGAALVEACDQVGGVAVQAALAAGEAIADQPVGRGGPHERPHGLRSGSEPARRRSGSAPCPCPSARGPRSDARGCAEPAVRRAVPPAPSLAWAGPTAGTGGRPAVRPSRRGSARGEACARPASPCRRPVSPICVVAGRSRQSMSTPGCSVSRSARASAHRSGRTSTGRRPRCRPGPCRSRGPCEGRNRRRRAPGPVR